MLFSSYEFIFVFLPITLALFLLFGRVSRHWALTWLIIASILFYTWWRPLNILIMAPSLLINFGIARLLVRLGDDNERVWTRQFLLILGIVFNVCFLGYFKYINFIQSAMNDFGGTDFVFKQIILPLGISFITFQKIAFLIDVHGRRVQSFTFRDFCLFISFFPQLIAGPIVHFREMMPQFHANPCRLHHEGLSVGLTLFFFGLFKKVVLADGIALQVTPIYELAAGGGSVSLFPAWVAAAGFTLQIYFDFSGYSDMAAGLGRCFGVRLPLNFDSPLKASSIIDFWSRWHVTLTRFLTAYIYNPLVLWLTRRRVRKGLPGFRGRNSGIGAFIQILAGPTLLTMFVSGLWHGAGYLFILWGLLHGVYLTINHAWRLVGPKLWSNKESYQRFMGPIGFLLTFVSVVFAMVLFRSPNVDTATEVLRGMLGLNGIGLPQVVLDRIGLFGILQPISVTSNMASATGFAVASAWVFTLLLIALALPNSIEIMARYEPVLGIKSRSTRRFSLAPPMQWSPTISWGVAVSALIVSAVMRMGGKSEFLYWQF